MNKTTLLIIDDVHLEGRPIEMQMMFAEKIEEKIEQIKSFGNIPILVCAGDIAENEAGLRWVVQFKCEIVYVCGNHEFWGGDYFKVIEQLDGLSKKIEYSHVHFLQNKSDVIHGIKFIGTTLWTDLAQSWSWFPRNQAIKNFLSMADFRRISAIKFYEDEEEVKKMSALLKKHDVEESKIEDLIINKRFNPYLQIQENKKAIDFIRQEIELETHPDKTVVVTHHLPCQNFWMRKLKMNHLVLDSSKINNPHLYEKYSRGKIEGSENILMMSFYTNDLKEFFKKNSSPNWWVHGHFHQEVSGYIGKTHVVSNPIGYIKQSVNIRFKEVILEDKINNVIDFLKKEVEGYDWNANFNEILKNFENIINQLATSLNMGLISIGEINVLVNLFCDKHGKNMILLEQKLLEWFNILLGVTKPMFFTLKHREDFFILSKIMNLENAVGFGGLGFNMPDRLGFVVNQLSFMPEDKFKLLNKNNEGIHYKDWIREIQKIQIQISQLKNFLIQLIETQRQ